MHLTPQLSAQHVALAQFLENHPCPHPHTCGVCPLLWRPPVAPSSHPRSPNQDATAYYGDDEEDARTFRHVSLTCPLLAASAATSSAAMEPSRPDATARTMVQSVLSQVMGLPLSSSTDSFDAPLPPTNDERYAVVAVNRVVVGTPVICQRTEDVESTLQRMDSIHGYHSVVWQRGGVQSTNAAGKKPANRSPPGMSNGANSTNNDALFCCVEEAVDPCFLMVLAMP